ncbi:hypothetical protein HMPREF9318_01741 [Streptococcus urinalis FB127-CNA-2]|uniref:YbaK/proline--tRNA ligase associated domain protein n=1 Tax=Streptococcus urinalis 2285-97 TaxID=764291 RepID=G5KEA7_9STRE|nr:YbaK/EbsC family protein [Streptococcus urinalis]EHJ56357.1 YbaK/proline--tRNA ligase associated domain protein [Streptococcus urinalis 2285-97]EKS18242.1 hypothetical protein HMPREF9318_01741 [Streptococcus urinalis FB127-CNA-2]VEF32884.1 prolyl-tRNA synthetase [Streptococcus urinalis]
MDLFFRPIKENDSLLPSTVSKFIGSLEKANQIKVAEIDPQFADGKALSQAYNVPIEMEYNCLVVEAKRQKNKQLAAVLVPREKRINMNATLKRPLNASKVSFANLKEVLEKTTMEFGSITPVGLPKDWPILVDKSVQEQSEIIVGGGYVHSKLKISVESLQAFPNEVLFIEVLAKD